MSRVREPLVAALRNVFQILGGLLGPVLVNGVNPNDLASRGAELRDQSGKVLDEGLGALFGEGKVAPAGEELVLNIDDHQGADGLGHCSDGSRGNVTVCGDERCLCQ